MQDINHIPAGKIGWRSPSNIALVKYWGKKPFQVPANPSLSMTLSRSYTKMTMEYWPEQEKLHSPFLEFLFEGKKEERFERKINDYLHSLLPDFPFLQHYRYRIESRNTFPHSAGIASSASSMSALGLCVAGMLSRFGKGLQAPHHPFLQQASRLARMASGSACRSVFGCYVVWGHVPAFAGTSNDYAIPVPFEVNPLFHGMKDAILVVSSKEKEISSRDGHALMDDHPYSVQRYELAMKHVLRMFKYLESGDMEGFIEITEAEAMNLHALMMSSSRSYFLFEPNTLHIVNAIRNFRKTTYIPVSFTLDAGPNVHMLYPESYEKEVKDLISGELVKYCEDRKWIDDGVGRGPEELEF